MIILCSRLLHVHTVVAMEKKIVQRLQFMQNISCTG